MRFLVTILMLFLLPFQSAYVLAAQSCTHAPDSVSQVYDSSDSDNSHFGHHSCQSEIDSSHNNDSNNSDDVLASDTVTSTNSAPTDKQIVDHSDHLHHVSCADVVHASHQLAYVVDEASEPKPSSINVIYTNPFLGMLLPPPNHVPA